jgi:3-oxoacyl-[acyl-carrier protein] reductase
MNPANGASADYQRSLTPLGRFAEPADIAASVVYLASPAARHVTGTIITVDGGLLA